MYVDIAQLKDWIGNGWAEEGKRTAAKHRRARRVEGMIEADWKESEHTIFYY